MVQILQEGGRPLRRHSSPDSTVGTMSRLRAEGTVVPIPVEAQAFFIVLKSSRLAIKDTQPPTQWAQSLFPDGKTAGT